MVDFKKEVRDQVDAIADKLLAKNRLASNSEGEAMVRTMRDIGEIMFGTEGMAVDYLNHFLGKSGVETSFFLDDLLRDNPTIARRVDHEARRRVLHIKTKSESRQCLKAGVNYLDGLDPCITVYQDSYDDLQWWGALGSFQIYISNLVYDVKRDVIRFLLTGRDTYRWAPDEARASQTVHKMAQTLIDCGWANEFKVSTSSIRMEVRNVEKYFITPVNLHQKSDRGIMGTGFTPGQIMRAIYVKVVY